MSNPSQKNQKVQGTAKEPNPTPLQEPAEDDRGDRERYATPQDIENILDGVGIATMAEYAVNHPLTKKSYQEVERLITNKSQTLKTWKSVLGKFELAILTPSMLEKNSLSVEFLNFQLKTSSVVNPIVPPTPVAPYCLSCFVEKLKSHGSGNYKTFSAACRKCTLYVCKRVQLAAKILEYFMNGAEQHKDQEMYKTHAATFAPLIRMANPELAQTLVGTCKEFATALHMANTKSVTEVPPVLQAFSKTVNKAQAGILIDCLRYSALGQSSMCTVSGKSTSKKSFESRLLPPASLDTLINETTVSEAGDAFFEGVLESCKRFVELEYVVNLRFSPGGRWQRNGANFMLHAVNTNGTWMVDPYEGKSLALYETGAYQNILNFLLPEAVMSNVPTTSNEIVLE